VIPYVSGFLAEDHLNDVGFSADPDILTYSLIGHAGRRLAARHTVAGYPHAGAIAHKLLNDQIKKVRQNRAVIVSQRVV
jgi:hypothetical protein